MANDRPLVAQYQGKILFPVAHSIAVNWGLALPYAELPSQKWSTLPLDWAWWPPIPYAPHTLDAANANYRSPLGPQTVRSWRWRHWLGTDKLGRDVLAGLVQGSRTAWLVGLVSMGVALVLGLFFGSLGGYFGDHILRYSRAKLWGGSLGAATGLGYAVVCLGPFLAPAGGLVVLLGGAAALVFGGLTAWALLALLGLWWRPLAATTGLPLDAAVLRLIELFNAVPTLVLLICLLGFLTKPGLLTVMLIIGLVRWTGIARFVRSELLRIRVLPYVAAARLSGFSHWRILLRHALPNALGPVMVAIAFGVAGAILLEAFLSFLNVGLPPDQVSWGSLLRQARNQSSAWWLAVFPGLAIFVTVLSLNVLGDALRPGHNRPT
ncbi:MAG: ABC transporter permease [Lewinella sp.]|nr:ABC transporter permease [Lewinella sp.]